MMYRRGVLACLVVTAFGVAFSEPSVDTQARRVDFGKDVQPILQQRCYGCHGPSQQMGGFRLDRRRAALAGALRPMIIPGSSESSRLYRRITGSEFGARMPPTGALSADEVDTLKAWLDQGAEWPDALANDVAPPPPSANALRLIAAIRSANTASITTRLADTAGAINERGRAGTTPLMYASWYGTPDLLRRLLDAGADPALRDDAGATALLWALDDVTKTRLLLDRGADPDAPSGHGRTPLQLAAQFGSADVVQLLLERGAKVTAGVLPAAAARGNVAMMKRLLDAGATDLDEAATSSLSANCVECIAVIVATQRLRPLSGGLLGLFPPSGGDPAAVKLAIDLGSDVNAQDRQGRTVLMKAVLADRTTSGIVQSLIDRGAMVDVKTADGLTALDFAITTGNKAVIDTLKRAGATGGTAEESAPPGFVAHNTRVAAIARSLPLLQASAATFYRKSGCVSCHHNALTAMTVEAARARKFTVDERLREVERKTVLDDSRAGLDAIMQGMVPFGGGPPSVGYVLLGLDAMRVPHDESTDAMVRLLRLSQQPDGHWPGANRPPIEASEFTFTAVNMRGIQQFRAADCALCDRSIERAVQWLSSASPLTTEDRVFRVFGLAWGHAPQSVLQPVMRDLLSAQRPDGGWSQLQGRPSDAYATGETLNALRAAGVAPSDGAYRRGVEYLLRTQLPDGSWFVRRRTHPTQPYFESGFPHGRNQYISAAATNWATLALLQAR